MAIDVVEPGACLAARDLGPFCGLELGDDRQPPGYAGIARLAFADAQKLSQPLAALILLRVRIIDLTLTTLSAIRTELSRE